MSEPKYREWILDTIDSLRSRKARPDLERICRMVRRRHGSEPDRTCLELEKLIQEQTVLKVNYKGSVSYRNAAKVQRSRRKIDRASSKSMVKQTILPDLGNGDSSLSPTDDQMGDMEVTLSNQFDPVSVTPTGPAEHQVAVIRTNENGYMTQTTVPVASERETVNRRTDSCVREVETKSSVRLSNSLAEGDACEKDVKAAIEGVDSGVDEDEVDSSLNASYTQDARDSITGFDSFTSSDTRIPTDSSTSTKPTASLKQEHACAHAEIVLPGFQGDTAVVDMGKQPLAICPSVQRSPLRGEEEGLRAEESALTPDELLADCRGALHQDEAVQVCGGPQTGFVLLQQGKESNKGVDAMTRSQDVNAAENGEKKRGSFLKREEIGQDPLQWSVADVASYFSAVGFPEQAVAFRTQEIDGKSLLLMQRSDVLTGLSIRLGPALKIYEHHVKVLQRSLFQDDSDLCSKP
ncbi:sterile alpha motif domain containing 1a [Chanos chanos]|uniref:Sterile alpha motif domain containing 1a n=1 Tax=Chanos chanos TaxID=29144 RepID=A0A6J2WM51_CHACN|nr:uncharacterized protein LOC115826035 [Chanos chanos]